MWQPEPIAPITDAFRYSNYVEAGLWSTIGIGFLVQAIRLQGPARPRCLIAAVTFLAFGASDYVEAHTGAWWHPWWLLVWKGSCLLVFALLLVIYFKNRRAPR
jgi:hypothetical protein